MGRIRVRSADVSGGRVTSMDVEVDRLPPRTVDRDTVVGWMRDGHSMIVRVDGRETALQLVEVGEDDQPYIRLDNEPVAEDRVA